ncbi:hypothetical protein FP026_06385 [Rhizobium tropici]|uniref:Uncharacterized protein n=1 Tax=Rhizobium tropici TaxID=398 RepID=A0A5B0W9L1_RHITR|nr:hypothetical protein [Rhizobium tropici]KAA1183663.1 hypothetical protein FP026_06385 [Rhizobium tropici]
MEDVVTLSVPEFVLSWFSDFIKSAPANKAKISAAIQAIREEPTLRRDAGVVRMSGSSFDLRFIVNSEPGMGSRAFAPPTEHVFD